MASPDKPHPPPSALARVALRLTDFSERWIPDAFIFALVATVVAVVAGLTLGGASPGRIVDIWGDGFWTLVPFTLQMAMIVILGTVVATAAPVRRLVDRLAGVPRTGRAAIVFVAVVSMATSWVNWGFGLIFSAVLARAIARRLPDVDYRTLAATTLLGLGSVWAQGLSGSAALQMATPGMLQESIRQIVATGGGPGTAEIPGGILSLADTIFLWQSLASVGIEIVVVSVAMWLLAPTGDRVRTARDLGIALDDDRPVEAEEGPRTPGEWLEHQPWLNLLVVLVASAYLVRAMVRAPSVTGAITLNTINLFFLTLGFALHRTPARLIRAFRDATPAVWGIILQFPFYAGIASIIAETKVNEHLAGIFTRLATPETFPALIAAYSALLGVFVPSGGSKWIIEAPYVMQAAHDLQVHLGWMVAVYDLGEALANLVQPFWMLPVLAMLGLRARDIMGTTFTVFLILTPVVLVLVTVLGMTLHYPL